MAKRTRRWALVAMVAIPVATIVAFLVGLMSEYSWLWGNPGRGVVVGVVAAVCWLAAAGLALRRR